MKTTKTKILALLLFFIASIPVLHSFYYNVSIYLNRELMRSRLESSQLVSVQVSTSKYLSDIFFSDEIEINGKMFDIESYKITGDKITVTGMYDENEDELVANNNNFHEKKKTNDSPLNNITLKFFSQFTLENFQRYNSFTDNCFIVIPRIFLDYNENPECAFLSKIFLPPKQVC